jgi:hypothetical protein
MTEFQADLQAKDCDSNPICSSDTGKGVLAGKVSQHHSRRSSNTIGSQAFFDAEEGTCSLQIGKERFQFHHVCRRGFHQFNCGVPRPFKASILHRIKQSKRQNPKT